MLYPEITWPFSQIQELISQSFLALSAETEGAASYGAAPSLILLQKTKSIDIGATDIEGVGGDCRHLAIVTLYHNRFFRIKFADLRNTPYLCSEKNKESLLP